MTASSSIRPTSAWRRTSRRIEKHNRAISATRRRIVYTPCPRLSRAGGGPSEPASRPTTRSGRCSQTSHRQYSMAVLRRRQWAAATRCTPVPKTQECVPSICRLSTFLSLLYVGRRGLLQMQLLPHKGL